MFHASHALIGGDGMSICKHSCASVVECGVASVVVQVWWCKCGGVWRGGVWVLSSMVLQVCCCKHHFANGVVWRAWLCECGGV